MEVGGRDKQKKKPKNWGANQRWGASFPPENKQQGLTTDGRFQMLNCGENYWPIDECEDPPMRTSLGKDGKPLPLKGDTLARSNYIRDLIKWLKAKGIL